MAEVTATSKKNEVMGKPLGLNTVKMLKVASQVFGISADQAMRTAEHLYLSGYTTYPRTESTQYSENFNFQEIIDAHRSNSEWGKFAGNLLKGGWEAPRQGVDKGDHPPITPVRSADKGELTGLEWTLYQFISRNFFATISSKAKFEIETVNLKIGDEDFTLKGRTIIEMGFLEVAPWLGGGNDIQLPPFKRGQNYPIGQFTLVEKETCPPSYLSEASLIGCMEEKGIGTDASIPSHIKNIIDRGYVEVGPGRTLIPTALGMALARGLCDIDPELILPTVRASIEQSCEAIAKGEIMVSTVVDHVIGLFKQKFIYFKSNFQTIITLIQESIIVPMMQQKDAQKSAIQMFQEE